MVSRRYVIVTPVRNEARHLQLTVDSIVSQTVRPLLWIIVNDGSTDTSGHIADQAARAHAWIKVIHREDRGFRKSGGGVMEAFYDGYHLVPEGEWEFLVKLDGDLSFPPDYFERCFGEFKKDPRLGIGGGRIYIEQDGQLAIECPDDPDFHVRGATKIYRRECWDKLGGLLRTPGWDTMDEVKANMVGWTTRTFSEIELQHHRPTGGADGSWKDAMKNGVGSYIVGYHPFFMAGKCFVRFFRKPYVIFSCGLMLGFLSGYVRGMPQVGDRELIRYLRTQQLRKMLGRPNTWR